MERAALGAVPRPAKADTRADADGLRLQLLGGFRLSEREAELPLPVSTWRLVAFLAILNRPMDRTRVANSLWLDKSEARAAANLRSCLWRLRQTRADVIDATTTHLALDRHIRVDVRDFERFARDLADDRTTPDLDDIDNAIFFAELLPDWYDDFLDVVREQIRQLQLHALESLAQRLRTLGRTNRALDVALTAVAAAPLRESAHRLVILCHLDEGNVSEALRHYDRMAALLHRDLAVDPSPAVSDLIAPWLSTVSVFRPPFERLTPPATA